MLAALTERACAVSSYTFAHGRAAASLPTNVVVRVIVNRNIVVHAVVRSRCAADAREDPGVQDAQQRLSGRWGRHLTTQQLSRSPSPPVQLLVCVPPLDETAS